MTPLQYCRAKAAPPASEHYYAIYFADPSRQPALLALYAFQAEIHEVARECRDPAVAKVKLNWWREELERAFAGQARHPVSQALQEPLKQYNLAKEYFEQIIDGIEMDLEYGSYPSFKALTLYCHRTGTSVTQLAIEICGYKDRATVRYAHDLGMALRLSELLQNVRPEAEAGRVYLPEDEMQAAGVTTPDLLRGQSSEALRGLFAQQAQRIADFFEQAQGQLADSDRYAQRSNIILGRLRRALLEEMAADEYPLLERRYALTPIRKFWLAWRTARRQRKYAAAR